MFKLFNTIQYNCLSLGQVVSDRTRTPSAVRTSLIELARSLPRGQVVSDRTRELLPHDRLWSNSRTSTAWSSLIELARSLPRGQVVSDRAQIAKEAEPDAARCSGGQRASSRTPSRQSRRLGRHIVSLSHGVSVASGPPPVCRADRSAVRTSPRRAPVSVRRMTPIKAGISAFRDCQNVAGRVA